MLLRLYPDNDKFKSFLPSENSLLETTFMITICCINSIIRIRSSCKTELTVITYNAESGLSQCPASGVIGLRAVTFI